MNKQEFRCPDRARSQPDSPTCVQNYGVARVSRQAQLEKPHVIYHFMVGG